MITNIIATILVSTITNWTEIYEQVPAWNNTYPCQGVVTPCADGNATIDVNSSTYTYMPWTPSIKQGKYLGQDGVVAKVTEIKFDHEGEPQVHHIEKPLANIVRRCHDKQPAKPERVWDEDIRTPIEPAENITAPVVTSSYEIITWETQGCATVSYPPMYIWSDGTVRVDKEPTNEEAK